MLPRALCAILLGAFVVIGLPVNYRATRGGYRLAATPYSSTDAYLTEIAPSRAFSETLVRLFDSFPQTSPVLIVYRDEEFKGTLLAQLMAYLAWPHPVQLLNVKPHALPPELQAQRFRSERALVVGCHVPLPPGSAHVVQLAADFAIGLPAEPTP